jgi:hypothetical protein
MSADSVPSSTTNIFQSKLYTLIYYRHVKTYSHWRFPKVVPMGAIVIRTGLDEGTESAEVATIVHSRYKYKDSFDVQLKCL